MKLSDFRHSTVSGAIARVFALGVQFLVLIAMSRLMPKEEFGLAMIAFAIYRVASFSLGTGIGNLVLYHVGRSGGDVELNLRVHRSATAIAFGFSSLVALVAAGCSDLIAQLFGQPNLAPWLFHMAPLMVFGTQSLIAMGSLEGRSRITEAIVMAELAPGIIRLVLIPLVVFLSLPNVAIAHVMWISVALSWAWEAVKLRDGAVKGLKKWAAWDVRYASLYALISLLSLQLQGIDIVIAGALFPPEVAADYAVAARLATLFVFFQAIVLKSFAPKAGALLRAEKLEHLNVELASVRWISLLAIGVLVGLLLLASPIVIMLFGNYGTAIPVLAVLALPALVKGGISGSDIVLKMSGHAGYSLAIAIAYVFFLFLVSVLLAPHIGVYSIPAGMLIGLLIVNPLVSVSMRKMGFHISGLKELLYVVLCCSVVGGVTLFSHKPYAIAAAGAAVLFISALAWLIYRKAESINVHGV